MNDESNWEGQPKVQENHRTLGGRAWCYTDKAYCYPSESGHCDCCLESLGWVRVWWKPDGTVVDDSGEKIDPDVWFPQNHPNPVKDEE